MTQAAETNNQAVDPVQENPSAKPETQTAPPKKKKPWFKRFRRWFFTAPVFESLLVFIVASFVCIIGWLPKRVAWFIGRIVGRLVGFLDRRHLRICLENLKIAFPEKSDAERNILCRKCYEHLGLVIVDFCRQRRMNHDNFTETIKPDKGTVEKVNSELERGKGMVAVTGHIGSWELSGCVFPFLEWPVTSIGRKLDSPKLDKFVSSIRGVSGNNIIHKEGALRILIRALKRNESIGIIMDQYAKMNAVPVPFFGREAMTIDSAAHMVLKMDAGLVCFGAMRQPDGSYLYKSSDPLRKHFTPTGDKEKDVYNILLYCNQEFEKLIREYPEQWLWMHRRWR